MSRHYLIRTNREMNFLSELVHISSPALGYQELQVLWPLDSGMYTSSPWFWGLWTWTEPCYWLPGFLTCRRPIWELAPMIMWASSPINPLSSICLPIYLLLVLSGETWLIGPQIWQVSNFGMVMCHVMLPHKHSWKQQTNLVQETKTITHCTADLYMVSTHRQFLFL